jgi:hypothetical protein
VGVGVGGTGVNVGAQDASNTTNKTNAIIQVFNFIPASSAMALHFGEKHDTLLHF